MSLNILIAPSGFNAGSLSTEIIDHIVQGVRAMLPEATLLRVSPADGDSRSPNPDQLLERADLVITADGEPEVGAAEEKASHEWVWLAKRYGIPVVALAGNLDKGITFRLQQP